MDYEQEKLIDSIIELTGENVATKAIFKALREYKDQKKIIKDLSEELRQYEIEYNRHTELIRAFSLVFNDLYHEGMRARKMITLKSGTRCDRSGISLMNDNKNESRRAAARFKMLTLLLARSSHEKNMTTKKKK